MKIAFVYNLRTHGGDDEAGLLTPALAHETVIELLGKNMALPKRKGRRPLP